ncbi:hypothetical protein IW261DRAFT_1143475 [Armillaria novae-zelandiae]|uniref:Transmembrane protein n=1 Tax=Armillaria novae-zelandiae TaxID=153914 RepID=A0AA39PAT8_9AGAR|nr:hypothetical protein IW261DRAFT_1143475 [Armillaria novae-zelandiae]
MSYQLDIPSDLTGSDLAAAFQYLDAQLNTQIVYAFLYGLYTHLGLLLSHPSLHLGIYTGIVAVTLWSIFTRESRSIGRRVMVVIIVLLFIVTTINFGFNWFYISSAFIDNGQSFWSTYSVLVFSGNIYLGMGITGAINTILADFIMIWRCWMVWGRRWLVVLPPISFLISGIVLKLIDTYQGYTAGSDDLLAFVLYLSFTLATTIWCTTLIIYRIVTVVRGNDGVGGGVGVYRHVIEVLVESASLYSVFLVLLLAFEVHGDWAGYYVDPMSGIARGVAPTLLVGRVATGHSRPDESWQGSVMSSLHFGSQRPRDQSSVEVETSQSIGIDEVLEAERGEMVKHKHTRAESHEYSPPSNVALQDDLEAQPESVGNCYGEAIRHMD